MKKIYFVLSFLLILLLSSCGFNNIGVNSVYTYSNSNLYESVNIFNYFENIRGVHISWSYGDVNITQGNKASYYVVEDNDNSNEDRMMHKAIINGILFIRCYKNGYHIKANEAKKTLNIEIPESISIEIVTVSSNVTASSLSSPSDININMVAGGLSVDTISATNNICINTVSADVNINSLSTNRVTLDGVSAVVDLKDVSATNVVINTVSGECALDVNSVNSISFSSVGASLTIKKPANIVIYAVMSSVSGKINGDVIHSASGYDISVVADTVAGNLNIINK